MNPAVINREQWRKVQGAGIFDEFRTEAVEDQPTVAKAGGKHGMVLLGRSVANQNQPQIVRWKSGFLQCDEFGDRIVLAIAFPGSEGLKGRAPSVGLSVLDKIGDIPNGRVYCAIGFIELDKTGL